MNGILVVNKPSGWTSHDVVKKIKNHFKLGKIGHAGTLDPNATGVLVLCIGAATRFVSFLPSDPKEYEGEMVLGVTTDTLDVTGKTLSEEPANLSREELCRAFRRFQGYMNQTPPMFSAVKVKGAPLYVLARQGKDIERKPKKVQIFELKILDVLEGEYQKILFKVVCSKGTYVRSLCSDIGHYLGCGACMGDLVRTKSGRFALDEAHTLKELLSQAPAQLRQIMIPLSEALSRYNLIIVKEEYRKRALSGGVLARHMIDVEAKRIAKGEIVRVLDSRKELLGLAKIQDGFSKTADLNPKQVVARPICIINLKL